MTWARLDDQFFTHPKVIDLSKDAKLLFLAGLTYCAAQLTDGQVTAGALRVIAATVDVDRAEAEQLTAAGLWEITPCGYQVHDYAQYNPSAESVKREREHNAKRQQEWRDRRRDNARDNGEDNNARNAVTQGVTNGERSGAPSPSYSPDQEEDKTPHLPRKGDAPHAVRQTPRKVAKTGRGTAMHPAVALFHEHRIAERGKAPTRDPTEEKRAADLWEDHGEETYRRALDGYFSCLGGTDDWPRRQNWTFVAFLRQFDKWEAGGMVNGPAAPSAAPAKVVPYVYRHEREAAARNGVTP